MPLRRKKWTEEEEVTLILKYGELLLSGFLSKAKSRERKFEPIAAHVNALFHAQNPVVYPWLWTWKDASTKVQNMRNQYLGVKQKIKKAVPSSIDPAAKHEEYEWGDGLSIWSNFLNYKAVFGDQEADADEFYTTQKDGEKEYEEPLDTSLDFYRHKRQRHCTGFGSRLSTSLSNSNLFAFSSSQFAELHKRETEREERELKRLEEREKRQACFEAERLKQMQEWAREKREMEEAARREAERRNAELQEQVLNFTMLSRQKERLLSEKERERDEQMEHERMAWREKMEKRTKQHEAEMMHLQMQIAQCLQNSIALLSEALSYLTGEGNGGTGQPSSSNAFFSQLIQTLQSQGNGITPHGIRRWAGESSDNQFDTDG